MRRPGIWRWSRTALILDPMLATGGSLVATVDMLKKAGCTSIRGIFLVAAPDNIPFLPQVLPSTGELACLNQT
ncbi:MAG: uracil phosphoribosyltransferase [Thermodesulfobacteriota bacterium]|nr:uracil phosphoribosyltransferase [Thermodesulfobacteriota bacterium]